MSPEMDMSDFLGVFLEEAEEQMQRLDDGILQLEKNPGDMEIIKEVFRAAHTLKGSSAVMGLGEIANLTHAMENLLDLLRSGAIAVTPGVIDPLLDGTDALRVLLGQVSRGESMELDTTDLQVSLKAACVDSNLASATVIQDAAPDVKGSAVLVEEGQLLIRMKVQDNCLMPAVRAFMVYNALDGSGEVISSDPPQDGVEEIQPGQVMTIVLKPSESRESITASLQSLCEVDFLECSYGGQESVSLEASRVIETVDTVNQSLSTPRPPAAGNAKGSEVAAKSIQTVRVGVDRLDTLMNLVAELVIDRTRITQIESQLSRKYEGEELIQGLGEAAAHVGLVVTELQEHIMKVRLLPVEQVFSRFPRMVRDLAHKAGKDVEFVMLGQETELDRSILEEIVDPLTHLLRNSVDHGVESPEDRKKAGKSPTSRVVLAAKQEENRIIIEVEDDGHGINIEKVKKAALKNGAVSMEQLERMSEIDCLQLIFASGVSTAEKITDVSGRGVGMDVVRKNIQGLSGGVEVHTKPGIGTRFRISLPLTLAIIQALVTEVDDNVYVIPLSAVAETFRCGAAEVKHIDGRPAINFRGSVLPLVHLGALLTPARERPSIDLESSTFVVINIGKMKVGLVVDKLIGEHEVVIKPLGVFFGKLRGIAGATILGDGRVALIADVAGLGQLLNQRAPKQTGSRLVEARAA